MYIVLGLGCFFAGWKLNSMSHEAIWVVHNVEFSMYDGLFVLGGLCIVRGLFKWIHD